MRFTVELPADLAGVTAWARGKGMSEPTAE